jgi:hypothetical protein
MWWPASGFIDTNITLMVHLLDTRLDGWYVDSLNSMVLIMRRDSAPSSNQQLFGWFLALPRPTSGQFINLTWRMHSYMVLFNYPKYVCKLNKSFYGLKQAPRTRFLWFTSFLCKLGFCGSKSDTSLFVLKRGNSTAYLLLYVHDIILTASLQSLLQHIIS